MSHLILRLYREFEKGGVPNNSISRDDKGRIDRIVANSGRNDIVVAVHEYDNLYNVIRIEPVQESRTEQIRRSMTNPKPMANATKLFKHCKYQLKRTEISEFRQDMTNAGVQTLHRCCHWNRNATRLRTAMSANQLVSAWNEWVSETPSKTAFDDE